MELVETAVSTGLWEKHWTGNPGSWVVVLALPPWSGGSPLSHRNYILSRDSAVSFNCENICEVV